MFEVQENSDVTFRLYDWDRVDPKTGKPRPLQVEQAMACIDFKQVAIGPVAPVMEEVAPVLASDSFNVNISPCGDTTGQSPFTVGAAGTPRVLVCLDGAGELENAERRLCPRQRRSVAPTRGGRRMLLSAARCHELVASRVAGVTMKKLIVFDLDGTLAESKCISRCRDGGAFR